MTTTKRLSILAGGVLVFHLLNSVLQEAVFHLPGFHHSVLLMLLQSFCIAGIAYGEYAAKGTQRRAPLMTYLFLSIVSTASGVLTNEASRLLNYPTQVLFKSSKLLVVMLVRATVFRFIGADGKAASPATLGAASPLSPASRPAFFRRQFLMEVASGIVIVAGIIAFTYATSASKMAASSTKSTHDVVMGVCCILVAMVCDALLYIGQERFCFKAYEAGETEVILHLYGLNTVNALLLSLLGGAAGGGVFSSFGYLTEQPMFAVYVLMFSACNFLGTKVLLRVVSEFDSNAAVVITSIRKVLTIMLSFIVYPKPVTFLHLCGGACVFGGVYLFEDTRVKAKLEKDREAVWDRDHPNAAGGGEHSSTASKVV